MTPRQEEIYTRSKARATAGWHSGFLSTYQDDDYKVALRGYRAGFFDRIRIGTELQEERRSKPVYSRRGI